MGDEAGKKMFGDMLPEWSHGDKKLFWTMADAMSDFRWAKGMKNEHHGSVTMRDIKRMNRIMHDDYQEVAKWYNEDSDDDEEDHKDDAAATDKMFLY